MLGLERHCGARWVTRPSDPHERVGSAQQQLPFGCGCPGLAAGQQGGQRLRGARRSLELAVAALACAGASCVAHDSPPVCGMGNQQEGGDRGRRRTLEQRLLRQITLQALPRAARRPSHSARRDLPRVAAAAHQLQRGLEAIRRALNGRPGGAGSLARPVCALQAALRGESKRAARRDRRDGHHGRGCGQLRPGGFQRRRAAAVWWRQGHACAQKSDRGAGASRAAADACARAPRERCALAVQSPSSPKATTHQRRPPGATVTAAPWSRMWCRGCQTTHRAACASAAAAARLAAGPAVQVARCSRITWPLATTANRAAPPSFPARPRVPVCVVSDAVCCAPYTDPAECRRHISRAPSGSQASVASGSARDSRTRARSSTREAAACSAAVDARTHAAAARQRHVTRLCSRRSAL